jgi:hypothetical protein
MTDIRDEFIVNDDYEKRRTNELIKRLLPFCKVSKKGKVILEDWNISAKEKVGIVLVSRYLASNIDSTISSSVTIAELSEYLLIPKNQVRARIKDLKNDKIVRTIERGIFQAEPTRIDKFLTKLENKEDGA